MSKYLTALDNNDKKVLIITHENHDFGAEDFKNKLGLKCVLSCGHLDINDDGVMFVDERSSIYNAADPDFIIEQFNTGNIKQFNLKRRYTDEDIILSNIDNHHYLTFQETSLDFNVISKKNQNKTFGYMSVDEWKELQKSKSITCN